MNTYIAQKKIADKIQADIQIAGSEGIPRIAQIVSGGMREILSSNLPGLAPGVGNSHLAMMDAVIGAFTDKAHKIEALIECINAFTLLRADPQIQDKIKDSMTLSVGYQIMHEIGGCTNLAHMIVEQDMAKPFFEAIDRFAPGGPGITYLADRCLSSGAIAYVRPETADKKLPGFVLVDKMIDLYPQWAQKGDIVSLLKSLSYTRTDQTFRTMEEAQAATRVVVKCLGYWLDNNKDKPYRLHLTSGPKENAMSVLGGLAFLLHSQLLEDQALAELTKGTRARRLDKTLSRALTLIDKNNKTSGTLSYDELAQTRVLIKVKALEAVAKKTDKPTCVARPAM